MWSFEHSTFNQTPLTDTYIDYCLRNCGQILKQYRLNGGASEWGFPHFCLTKFLLHGESVTRYRFSRIEKAYLKDAIAYLEEHGIALWQDYKDLREYREEVARSYVWIRNFKNAGYKYPPKNYFELDLAFAAAECFMMLEEKNLL